MPTKLPRITCTVSQDLKEEIALSAKKRDMTVNEWLRWAAEQAIEEEHGQYGLAGLSAQRLNQLQNSMVAVNKTLDNLMQYQISSNKLLTNLISGESYLNDDDDLGE